MLLSFTYCSSSAKMSVASSQENTIIIISAMAMMTEMQPRKNRLKKYFTISALPLWGEADGVCHPPRLELLCRVLRYYQMPILRMAKPSP